MNNNNQVIPAKSLRANAVAQQHIEAFTSHATSEAFACYSCELTCGADHFGVVVVRRFSKIRANEGHFVSHLLTRRCKSPQKIVRARRLNFVAAQVLL